MSHSIHSLKSQLAQLRRMRDHLHSVIGHQINSLDKTLEKISGGTPITTTSDTSKLQATADARSASLVSSIIGSVSGMPALGKFISGNSTGMSQSQLLSQVAKSITKASQRNL